jgi:hypothetical protein
MRILLLELVMAFFFIGSFGCGESGPEREKGKNPFQAREERYKEMMKDQGKDKAKDKSKKGLLSDD